MACSHLEQFGPISFPAFEHLGQYSVCSAWRFPLIPALLVVLTSQCVMRNVPRMLREVDRFHDSLRKRRFDNFARCVAFSSTLSIETMTQRQGQALAIQLLC